MNRKSFSTLIAACCVAASMSGFSATPVAAQTNRASTPSAISERQFAKCAATYDFMIDTMKRAYQNGSISRFQYDDFTKKLIANRGLLGTTYFSQKNSSSSARIKALIDKEMDIIADRMVSGRVDIRGLSAEGDQCYYNYIRR